MKTYAPMIVPPPPDYCGLGPVLSLGEGLLWKFNGEQQMN